MLNKRNKRELTDKEKEERKALKNFRKNSSRHVLVLETDLGHAEKCKIFHYANIERKAGNELTGIMKNKYEQLIRTKQYRKLKELYRKNIENEEIKKDIAEQMKKLQKQYNVTWDYCRQAMIPIGKKYNLDSIIALTKAEDVWHGVERCLYSDGKTLHFAKYTDLPCIRAKQINRGIILKVKDSELSLKFGDFIFGVKIKDRFDREETEAIINYLNHEQMITERILKNPKEKFDTYRPCFVSLVCQEIRGKLRVYAHITVEGKAIPKYDRFGELKHKLGKGIIGCDIGTQTIAYTSDKQVGLKNLAERGASILENERKERLLNRAMDRSRRATNPENYNEDGTIKKGKKVWKKSKRYLKLQAKHKNLCRKNAINRHLAINEDVNRLRSIGDVFITEPKNAKKLQKKAKNTTKNSKGKFNKKKRFGKSIKNRCPGYFQAQIERKFTSTGGKYIEVPNDYKASQYDHTADEYIKKKLSERMYKLKDGTEVQRDWYSSYLLYCLNFEDMTIDKEKCKSEFIYHYVKEQKMIETIKQNNIKIMNSGIKIS